MGFSYSQAGLLSETQSIAVFIIALSSVVIYSILFFKATHMARTYSAALAAVEATQSVEIF
ncbi:multidrug resistance efflux transporter family protein [Pontibacter sp. H249]|uniref:multidrug resistance efflux transporter family protein n=1 Tax=Pontibacter sp. H249 TaxID=3133420 RepID=UPI0030BCA779